jgi:hypothetical protein
MTGNILLFIEVIFEGGGTVVLVSPFGPDNCGYGLEQDFNILPYTLFGDVLKV